MSWSGTDPDLHPGAPEQRDGLDQDCDGIADEGLIDEGDLVFSEMMPNPDLTPDSRGEWFEVRNTTSIPIDMTGWIVSRGSESFEVNTAVKVPAGGVRVFSNSDNPGRNGGFKSDFEFDAAAFGMPNTTNETYEIVFQSTRVASVVLQATKITAGASTGLDPRVSALASARDMTNWCTAVQSMSGGDLGTPGMPNDECPGLTDVDGDGYTLAGGDCDDSDASVHPGATEVWGDWIDNDCDGSSDTATITGLSSLYLDGDSSGSTPDFLGYRGNLSLGDVDADGTPELILGSYYAQEYLGGVYVVPSEDYASFGGSVSAVADATVVGFAEGHYLGAVDTHMADNTGDSRPDLVVAGHDYYEPDDNVAVAVFKGSSLLSGTLASTDATLLMTGSLSFKNTRVVSSADLNGDGVAEVVYGEGYDYYGAGEDNYAGRVVVVDTDGLSGTMALEDGDALWVGAVTYDYLGTAMGGGDLDGDGYDELLVGAAGEDTGASLAGSVYVVPGASSLPSSGTIEDEYSIKITGDTKNGKLGDGPAPQLADLDGDSRVDLVVSAYDVDTVYVFYDIASLTGVVSVSSADLAIQGSGAPDDFGLGLSTGDFDGDGFDDLAMGAPDDDTNDPGSHATVTGQVYVFLGSGLGSGSLTDSDADATVTGVSSAGGFGQSLLSMDLDGDGCDDLLVNAPGAQSNQGRVYFWVMK